MTVTKELIDKIVNGENSVASDEVIDLLYAKASEALDSYKKEYAAQIMNPERVVAEPTEPEVGEGDPNIDAPQPEGSAEEQIEEPTTEPEPEEEQ